MKNILVGIHLSEQSPIVFKFALRLAQYHAADLTVALILDSKDSEVSNIIVPQNGDRVAIYEAFRQQKIAQLEAFMATYYGKQYHSVKVETEVRFGYTHEQLCHIAQEMNHELLIIGKFTKSRLSFFADTADKLINYTPCPLLIVPEDATFHAFKRIIYTADFILEDCAAILYLQQWLKVFDSTLIGLHICQTAEQQPAAEKKIELLKALFPQKNIDFRCIVASVTEGIDRYTTLSKSELIAMTHRDRGLWDSFFKASISKAIASDAQVPVLVFQQS